MVYINVLCGTKVLCPNHHRLFDSSRLSQEEYNKIKSKVEAVFKQPEKVA